MQGVWMLLTFLAGAGLVVQVGMNAAVGQAFGRPLLGALVNFVVGLFALTLVALATRAPLPSRETLAAVPWWAWLGGTMGALYVTTATIAGPRLGAVLLLALGVAGQMVASLVVDHYGLLGFPQQPVTVAKIVGVLLLCAGIALVAR
jgi:transporter family-2 protein